jgi:hypothetical protein
MLSVNGATDAVPRQRCRKPWPSPFRKADSPNDEVPEALPSGFPVRPVWHGTLRTCSSPQQHNRGDDMKRAVVQIDGQSKKRTVSQFAHQAESTAFHTAGVAVSLRLLRTSN